MRKSIDYTPSSIHLMDRQGSALVRFIAYKQSHLDCNDLFILQNFISPDWLVHILNVESDDSAGFYFERYDERCLYGDGVDLNGYTLSEMNDPTFTAGILNVIAKTKLTGKSHFSLESITGPQNRTYLRYATPLKENGHIREILFTCRYQEIDGKDPAVNRFLPKDRVFDFMI
ncbi:MAG: hypothetical protein V7750_06170 [Sneathiella sp.]